MRKVYIFVRNSEVLNKLSTEIVIFDVFGDKFSEKDVVIVKM